MEIKRLNENQIRCAISEQEIEEMGFCIDDIIGNTENAQKFMHLVLEKVEEQEAIDVEALSPIVRAELLQDHSMTITFGGITEEEKQGMLSHVMDLIEQLAGKAVKQQEEKKAADLTLPVDSDEKEAEEDRFKNPTPFALEFLKLDGAITFSRFFSGEECIPESALYKTEGKYYLVMDFIHFSKKALRPAAFAAVEYDSRHIAAEAAIAHIIEHGNCLIAQDALVQLMQL